MKHFKIKGQEIWSKRQSLNFIVTCITTFLIVLLLSTTVYAQSNSDQNQGSVTDWISILVAFVSASATLFATVWNGINPRATLKSDIEIRKKLLEAEILPRSSGSNTDNNQAEIKLIEEKIKNCYKHIYGGNKIEIVLGSVTLVIVIVLVILGVFFDPDKSVISEPLNLTLILVLSQEMGVVM